MQVLGCQTEQMLHVRSTGCFKETFEKRHQMYAKCMQESIAVYAEAQLL